MRSVALYWLMAMLFLTQTSFGKDPHVFSYQLENEYRYKVKVLNLTNGKTTEVESRVGGATAEMELKLKEARRVLSESGDVFYGLIGSPSPLRVIPSNRVDEVTLVNPSTFFEKPAPERADVGSYMVVKARDGGYALVFLQALNQELANIYWVLNDGKEEPFSAEQLVALQKQVQADESAAARPITGTVTLRAISTNSSKAFLFEGQRMVDMPAWPSITSSSDEGLAYQQFIREKCDLVYDTGMGQVPLKRGNIYLGAGLSCVLGKGRLMDFAERDLREKLKPCSLLDQGNCDGGTVIVLKTQARRYALIRVESADKEKLTIRWVYQPDGTAIFPKVEPLPGETQEPPPVARKLSQSELDNELHVLCCETSQDRRGARETRAKALIQAGANVNMRTALGSTPLLCAVFYEQTNVMRLIVDAGADVKNSSCLCEAARNGDYEMAKYLLDHGACVDCVDIMGETPLQVALNAKKKDDRLMELLRNTNPNAKSIFAAIATSDTNAVVRLIARGADVNQRNQVRETPLHVVARSGNTEITRMLLAAKADTTAMVLDRTALEMGVAAGHKEVVSLLLPCASQEMLIKALSTAVGHNQPEICDMILKASTNVEALLEVDRRGTILAMMNAGPTNMVDIFAANGMKLPFGAAARLGRTDLLAAYLKAGFDVNGPAWGQTVTALQMAIKEQRADSVRFLLEKGADPNKTTKGVRAPLNWAVDLDNAEIVMHLLDHKANVNIQDDGGITPLLFAVGKNNHKIVKMLLDRGADPNLFPHAESDGKSMGREPTLLDRARDQKMKDLLKEYGAK